MSKCLLNFRWHLFEGGIYLSNYGIHSSIYHLRLPPNSISLSSTNCLFNIVHLWMTISKNQTGVTSCIYYTRLLANLMSCGTGLRLEIANDKNILLITFKHWTNCLNCLCFYFECIDQQLAPSHQLHVKGRFV